MSTKNPYYILSGCIYCQELIAKGGYFMRETDDPTADLEDLIYDEDGGYPSQR